MPSQTIETNSSLPLVQRFRLLSFCLGGLGATGMAVVGAIDPALAASLTNWHYDPEANQLEITVKDGTTPNYFVMAQPARIVVDLPDTELRSGEAVKTYPGVIRSIRVSQFKPGLTRIVMQLSPDASLAPGQVKLHKAGGSNADTRWVVRPLLVNPIAAKPLRVEKLATAAIPLPPKVPARPVVPPSGVSVTSAPPIATAAPLVAPTTRASTTTNLPSVPDVTPAPDSGMVVDTAGAVPIMVPVPVPVSEPSTTKVTVPPLGKPDATSMPPSPVATPQIVVPSGTTPSARSGSRSQTESLPEIPTTIASTPPSPTPLITVPPLSNSVAGGARSADSSPFPPASGSTPTSSERMPSSVVVPKMEPVSVPPLQSTKPGNVVVPSDMNSAASLQSSEPLTIGIPPSTYPPAVVVPPLTSPAPGTVTVPPVQRVPASSVIVQPMQPMPVSPNPAVVVPPVQPMPASLVMVQPMQQPMPVSPNPAVVVPPVQPMPASSVMVQPTDRFPSSQPPVSPASPQVVEFGQPLPTVPIAPTQSSVPGLAGNSVTGTRLLPPDVLLPAGSTISLRYPGEAPLKLSAGTPQQEVLLLQTEIRDSLGKVVAPEGTPIVGRFETSSAGSRFVAQAMSLQGRSVPLPAQSDGLGGNRQMADNTLVRNAGIGLLAGGLIGGLAGSAGAGVLGGAAAGAAATFLTAPKPATIQPGQVVQVRLIQDLRL